MKYNAMRFFKAESEARKFAEQVGSDSWGSMIDTKTGKVTSYYVDYNLD